MKRSPRSLTQISQGKTAGKPKAKSQPAVEEKPVIEAAIEEQPVTLTEPSVQSVQADVSEEPVTDLVLAPDVAAGVNPSIETLAAAVEEIKKYIHNEISILKEEIKALRKQ